MISTINSTQRVKCQPFRSFPDILLTICITWEYFSTCIKLSTLTLPGSQTNVIPMIIKIITSINVVSAQIDQHSSFFNLEHITVIRFTCVLRALLDLREVFFLMQHLQLHQRLFYLYLRLDVHTLSDHQLNGLSIYSV